MTTLLGIETSCDETSAAVVVDGVDVRSNIVASQVDLHAKYGGVVPEIASRAHIERLDSVIQEAMVVAKVTQDDIDAVAVTHRPGLVGALVVGVTAAKTLSWAWGKPLIGVDHIRAHAYSPAIGLPAPPWPAVALIVSGGHTSLFRVHEPTEIELLGATIDDAAGEAFDKVATILGLGYPGGPLVEKLAKDGDPQAVDFPRTMLEPGSLDFSFSGVKTAVLYHVHGPGRVSGGLEKLSPKQLADIAASFQQSVIDVLIRKTMLAVARARVGTVVLGGGVAANRTLRSALERECASRNHAFHAAPMAYCTDNAAMIAALGYHQLLVGDVAELDLDAYARRDDLRRWIYRVDEVALRQIPELRLFPTESQRLDALQQLEMRSVLSIRWLGRAFGPVVLAFGLMALWFGTPLRSLRGVVRLAAIAAFMLIGMIALRLVIVYLDRRRAAEFLRQQLMACGVPICLACGYCLRGLASDRCPECGREIDERVAKLIRTATHEGLSAS